MGENRGRKPGQIHKVDKIEDFDASSFGENINWKKIEDPKSYYPTRLEYFAGKALQGLVAGRSQKDLSRVNGIAAAATELASALEQYIDRATQD